MNKKKVIISIVSVVLLLLIGINIFIYFSSPAHKLIKALKDNDINTINDVYSQIEGHPIDTKIYSSLLPGALKEINEKYNNDSLSYDNVSELYETVNTFSTEKDTEKYYSDFIELYESKTAFQTGQEALQKRDYPEAISNYKKVIEKDRHYDKAQDKIAYSVEMYVKKTKDSFYSYVMDGNYTSASKFIDKALETVEDESLKRMKENLTKNVYDKCKIVLNNIEEWQVIEESHAGENVYCCYRIYLSEQNPNYFGCHYVVKSLNTQVQNGAFGSIGGPFVWYKIKGTDVVEMTYDEDKNLTEKNSVSWDYTSSKTKKFEQLEELFS